MTVLSSKNNQAVTLRVFYTAVLTSFCNCFYPMQVLRGLRSVSSIFALAAITVGCARSGSIESDVATEFTAKRTAEMNVENTIVSYRLGCSEPTVVFMHGIPSSSYLWRNVMPIVAERAKTIAFDLPGYGESSVPVVDKYDYASVYTPMASWLNRLPEQKIVLVVNDLGSLLGLDWTVHHPDRIAGIVLADAVFMPTEQWYKQLTFSQKAMFAMMRADWLANAMIVSKPRMQSMVWGMGMLREPPTRSITNCR